MALTEQKPVLSLARSTGRRFEHLLNTSVKMLAPFATLESNVATDLQPELFREEARWGKDFLRSGTIAVHERNAGTWELDLSSDVFSLSSAAGMLLGVASGPVAFSSILGQMYYSGDREALSGTLKQAQKGRRNFAVTFRVWNGELIWLLEMRGKTFYNAGAPIMLGVLLDLTPASSVAA